MDPQVIKFNFNNGESVTVTLFYVSSIGWSLSALDAAMIAALAKHADVEFPSNLVNVAAVVANQSPRQLGAAAALLPEQVESVELDGIVIIGEGA